MHAFCINTCTQLMKLWILSEFSGNSYFLYQLSNLQHQLDLFKFPHDISRAPSKLKFFEDWKAAEMKLTNIFTI
jgi:hypothetical protein